MAITCDVLTLSWLYSSRLQKLAERIYPESQCGFRTERSTMDSRCPCTSLSLISQRHLIWSEEMAYLRFSQRSVAHPNCREWSSLSTLTQGAKTINVFRACLGAQLTICAQKWRNFVLFSMVSFRFVLSRVCVFLYSLGPRGTVQFNGSSSEPFEILCGVKQGCVLAPTLSGIFFCSVWARNWKTWDTCLTKLRHVSPSSNACDQALATWKEH